MSVRVLVVEDEKNLVNLLRGYLEREGFEVYEALDGVSEVEVRVREGSGDAVFSVTYDVYATSMSGRRLFTSRFNLP